MSSRQTFSAATQLFFGKVTHVGAYNGKRGAPMSPLFDVQFGAPIVEDADAFIKAATGAEIPDAAETVSYTFPAANVSPTDSAQRDGAMDVPRNVVIAVTHATSIVAMTFVVYGTDVYGRSMRESFSISATGTSKTATGKKAFATITQIDLTAAADASANTVDIGTGKALGLPVRVDSGGARAYMFNDAVDAGTFLPADTTDPATGTTGDVRGTYAPAGTLDGAKTVSLLAKIADPETEVGVYGVDQYAG